MPGSFFGVPCEGSRFENWLGCCLSVFEAFGGSESDRDLRFMEPSLLFSMSTVDLTDLACGSRRRTLMSNGMRTCMANCWPLAVERRGWPATSRISTLMHGFLRTADVHTLITHSQVREHKGTAQCLLRGFPWIEFYLGRCPHLSNRGGQKAFICSKGSLSTFTWCYLRLCKMTCTIILNCRLCHHMRWERLRPCSAIPSSDGQLV